MSSITSSLSCVTAQLAQRTSYNVLLIGQDPLLSSEVDLFLRARGCQVSSRSRIEAGSAVSDRALDRMLRGKDIVIDLTLPNEREGDVFLYSFERLLMRAACSEVEHVVVPSTIGSEQLKFSSYHIAKVEQEKLLLASEVPYTLVRMAQLYDSVLWQIPETGSTDVVRVTPSLVQPMAGIDAAKMIVELALGTPQRQPLEVAGPELDRLCDLVRWAMRTQGDTRSVLEDPRAAYLGTIISSRTLTPTSPWLVGSTYFEQWLLNPHKRGGARPIVQAAPGVAGNSFEMSRGRRVLDLLTTRPALRSRSRRASTIPH